MLNENLKSLRKAKGLSQEELAEQLHVVRQTVSKWEKGLSVPDSEMLIRLAGVLETSTAVLLGETIETPEEEQETLRSLAAKLELLNEQFALRRESRRRTLRFFYVVLFIVALALLASEVTSYLHFEQMKSAMPDSYTTIIGGADAPTSLWVSNTAISPHTLNIIAAMIGISVTGFIRTRRR